MAVGLVNHFLGQSWKASSAGLLFLTHVHPLTRRVMNEIGIDISHQYSNHVDAFEGRHFDLIMTLCGDVDAQCPAWIGKDEKVFMGFIDPAAADGTEEEVLAIFRMVRDDIQDHLPPYLHSVGS